MNVLIIYNRDRDSNGEKILKLINILNKIKVTYDINSDYKDTDVDINTLSLGESNYDMVIAFGGDGTVMHGCKYALKYDIPILGVNIGSLGFLTQISFEQIEKLNKLVSGEYKIDNRVILETKIGDDKFYGVNDIVVARGNSIKLIKADLYCSNQKVCSYKADGLIVATPMGSTAYSLAAGGPIVEVSMKCLVVTPISSHSLKDRPIIFNADKKLKIISQTQNKVQVSCDGILIKNIDYGQSLEIKVSNKVSKFINFDRRNYLKIFDNPI